MTATTDIQAFATGVGANVLTPAQYAALTSLIANGFSSGTAQSIQLNTVWRQSSFMAAGVANWMVNRGISVPDDGNLANLVAEIEKATNAYLSKSIAGSVDVTLNPVTEANFPMITLTGVMGANFNLITPARPGWWIFTNQATGGFQLTIRTAAGTGVVIPTGQTMELWSDGTNVYAVSSGMSQTAADARYLQLAGGTLTGLLVQKTGSNIASAATLNLSTATGNTVHITGTTATTAVTMTTGQWMECIADAAWPLTYHATNNKLNTGGSNYTCAAGDSVFYFYDGTTVYGQITKSDGTPVVAPTVPDASTSTKGKVQLATSAEAIAGTDALKAITPATLFGGLNASGSAPIYACRAWVNFNGTGTVAIRASGNVSSITDNGGSGDYTVNFSTAMPDVNYSVSSTGSGSAGSYTGTISLYHPTLGTNPLLTSGFRIKTTGNGGLASYEDSVAPTLSVFR